LKIEQQFRPILPLTIKMVQRIGYSITKRAFFRASGEWKHLKATFPTINISFSTLKTD